MTLHVTLRSPIRPNFVPDGARVTLHVTVGVTPDMDAGGDDEDEVTGQGAAACAATIVLVAVILGGCVAAPRPAS
ncbi:MAG TPA: hypothetical protein VKV73_04100, partial [Chloroflexota bacterium]|nr:hypothetical protein [Chloroflexota bacterium]